jgi:pyruvate dehydrogenase E2 component (dihydrolipoamide acetyltransferase)
MIKVMMPKAGQSMEEGTILQWRKREGEPVEKGEILLEVDTDKATVEVEAPESGFVRRILRPEGEIVPVLEPIAIIAGETEDISAELGGEAPAPPPEEPGRPKASPAARGAAARLGVQLGSLGQGSGPGGRILSTDVNAAAQLTGRQPAPAPATPAAQAAVPAPAAPSPAQPAPEPLAVQPGATARPLTGMRRAIARGMTASKSTVPHFYTKLTIDAGPLYAFYREQKAKHACTINDIVTLACARVIRDFPAFRSRVEGDQVVEYPAASIGVAVAVEEGLVVPVVLGADSLSLAQIAGETHRIIDAARKGKVVAMGQGVFTVSNLGSFGIEEFTAIINPPESGILAVGAIRESVLVRDAGLRPARVMTVTLSADHRLIDGLMAARFLSALKVLLEAPAKLL